MGAGFLRINLRIPNSLTFHESFFLFGDAARQRECVLLPDHEGVLTHHSTHLDKHDVGDCRFFDDGAGVKFMVRMDYLTLLSQA